MNKTERRRYMKQYRETHRDFDRRRKGYLSFGRVGILGVMVDPRWMPIPSVTKDEAEREFLRLTDEPS